MATLRFGNLPTIDPFILGMMEKQRNKIRRLESKIQELKNKIKSQKKELKQKSIINDDINNNNITNFDEKKYLLKIDQLNKIIGRLRAENEELMDSNSIENNTAFEYQTKYEKLKSDHELLKLDYSSIKKELNKQKNHNFWLMEDYNQLKKNKNTTNYQVCYN